MSRRLLGPVGGPVAFFLVAALVFGGLGWVTYSALRVEEAQREAAARAELGSNLRVALRTLDLRTLPVLSGEDTRPYFHYAPADPAATPLLVAKLPDWMKLHFQLDPADGWCSPQVLPPETADKVRQAWADVPTRNLTPDRAAALDKLKLGCPAHDTYDAFAATYRASPDDAVAVSSPPPVATPLPEPTRPEPAPSLPPGPVTPTASEPTPQPIPPPLPGPGGVGGKLLDNSDTFCLFGWELCPRPDPPAANNPRPDTQQSQKGVSARGGRMTQQDNNKDQASLDYMNRQGILDRALREAKQAAEHQLPKNQLQNFGQYGPNDPRMQGGPGNPTTNNTAPGGAGGFGPPAPGGGAAPGAAPPPGLGGERDNNDKSKGTKDGKTTTPAARPGAGDAPGKGRAATPPDGYRPEGKALQQEQWDATQAAGRDLFKKVTDKLEAAEVARTLEAHGWSERLGNDRFRRVIDEVTGRQAEAEKGGDAPAGPMTPPAAVVVPAAPPAAPTAIHLGSMRPQWVTAPDGTEILVLVRTAKVDGKTVYQGVILDWAKLEASLRDEVKDLFPDARLTAVKDPAAVSPDRAMTALPVELDPGPEPPLPPAGWTTLRLGLVLAWVAAVIAFAAVGFTGWSLIDLAERRIRFVSAVTHELRTPLTSLRLYLDLLVSGMIQDEAKRQEYLSTLAVESDRLHRLIDNVLDFARLEKRRKNGDVKPVNVTALLDQVRQTWTDRAAQDGKELVVISTLPPEREVTTDAAMIQQIVGNLIDNARKYTRDAADKRIWVWAKPGPGSAVLLEVEDRGPGVPAGERKSIFKPFRRGDAADSKAGGAGLGLALAKSWAEVLGARLTYRPADGGTGACFRLELPGR